MNTNQFTYLGFDFGLSDLTGLQFKSDRPYTCCLLCGAMYQSPLDRSAQTVEQVYIAEQGRKAWSHSHSSFHTAREHHLLKLSGRWCTPEAAFRLAPFGIGNLKDLVFDDEVEHALAEAPRKPNNDTESSN